jgi:hypothetical protein
MKINNKQADALESNMTTEELGQAMNQLDLSSVPPHKRKSAVMDHLMRIMAQSILDKEKANEIHVSRLLRSKLH